MSNGIQALTQVITNAMPKQDNSYDKTFFARIVKTDTEVSDSLTADEKSQLDELTKGWYYVKLYGVCYKLQCQNCIFEIDSDIKVVIPCGNYNRMYVDVSSMTFEVLLKETDWVLGTADTYSQSIKIKDIKSTDKPIFYIKYSDDLSIAKNEKAEWKLDMATAFNCVTNGVNESGITFICLDDKPLINLNVSVQVVR